ncbi:IS3 family transposase [Histomonas meleagridis]|nr:IS3 family transposase [Histomonas meleagridis]
MFRKLIDPCDGIDLDAFRRSIEENGVEATMKIFFVGRERLRAICQQANIPIPGRGRPANNASQETISYIQGYKSDYHGAGYQRPPKKPNEHNSLFVVRYAGQLWHADIHYVRIDDNQFYLLGFIDDRTRFLLHYEVLASKDSKLCSEALERALNKVQFRPKMLAIDNGGEFVGNPFQIVLSANGIEEFRTHPYTPPAEWEDRKILVYDRES